MTGLGGVAYEHQNIKIYNKYLKPSCILKCTSFYMFKNHSCLNKNYLKYPDRMNLELRKLNKNYLKYPDRMNLELLK